MKNLHIALSTFCLLIFSCSKTARPIEEVNKQEIEEIFEEKIVNLKTFDNIQVAKKKVQLSLL